MEILRVRDDLEELIVSVRTLEYRRTFTYEVSKNEQFVFTNIARANILLLPFI
jgi:hypothetical protein